MKPFRSIPIVLVLCTWFTARAQMPDVAWVGKVDAPAGLERATKVVCDAEGNTYVLCLYNGRITFEGPAGPVVFESHEHNAVLLMKMTAFNTWEWARNLTGTGDVVAEAMAVDAEGNVVVGGGYSGVFDANPEDGEMLLGSNGAMDGFVLKMTPAGQLVWAVKTGSTSDDGVWVLAIDATGGIVASGSFNGSVDFDPGDATAYLGPGSDDVFLWKLNAQGAFEWVKGVYSTYNVGGRALVFDDEGNLLHTGEFVGAVDLDPGPSNLQFYANNTGRNFLQKFNPAGNLLWACAYGQGYPKGMVTDPDGAVYTVGTYQYQADFDPGQGTYYLNDYSGYESEKLFLLKLDADGHFVWARELYSVGWSGIAPTSLTMDDENNLYTTGIYGGEVDFDPGSGVYTLESTGYSYDAFVQKLDTDGALFWAQSYGGLGNELPYSIAFNLLGELVTGGLFSETVDFDPGPGVYSLTAKGLGDMYFQKLTTNGDFLWATRMGELSGQMGTLNLVADAADRTVVCGNFLGEIRANTLSGEQAFTSHGNTDVFVQQWHENGGLNWMVSFGGDGYEYSRAVAVDADNNIYIAGAYSGYVDFDPGPGSFVAGSVDEHGWYVLKLNQQGTFVWVKTMSGAFDTYGSVEDIEIDAQGNIVMTGYFEGEWDFDPGLFSYTLTGDYNDVAVVKLNSLGNFVWAKAFGGINGDYGTALTLDAAGNVYVTGTFAYDVDFDPGPGTVVVQGDSYDDVFLEKLNSAGEFQWVSVFQNEDSYLLNPFVSLVNNNLLSINFNFRENLDADPGPGVSTLQSAGSYDVALINLNLDGQFLQAASIGGEAYEEVNAMDVDEAGNLYLAGTFEYQTDVDPSQGGTYYLDTDGPTSFLLKLDANLAFQWAGAFNLQGKPPYQLYPDVAITPSNDIVFTTNYTGSADADPGPGVYPVSTGSASTFVVRFNQTSSLVEGAGNEQTITAWPNPTTGPLTIDLGDEPLDVEITVTGVEGKLLKRLHVEDTQLLDVPLDGLMPGVYFVTIRGEGIWATVRVVKE